MATKTVGNLGGIEGIKVVCRDGTCWPRQYGKDLEVRLSKRTVVAHPKSKKGQAGSEKPKAVAARSAFKACANQAPKGPGSGPSRRKFMSACLKKKGGKKGKK